jgi:hypothetical protein
MRCSPFSNFINLKNPIKKLASNLGVLAGPQGQSTIKTPQILHPILKVGLKLTTLTFPLKVSERI